MTKEKAAALVALLDEDETFEDFASRYVTHLEAGGGLEDVLEELRAEAGR